MSENQWTQEAEAEELIREARVIRRWRELLRAAVAELISEELERERQRRPFKNEVEIR